MSEQNPMEQSTVNRINIPFTNEHFIAFCERMLGQPYWYGTCIYKCKTSLLDSKTRQYPNNYPSSRRKKYEKDIADKKIAADCIGGCKGYAWTNGGQGVIESIGTDAAYTSKYGSSGCPDKGANSMFTYAKNKRMRWGEISTLPEIVGLALYKKGHAGYYAGKGYTIEWRGTDYGCVKTKVQGRGWTHWYMLPFIDYGDVNTSMLAPIYETKPPALGDRLLKNGSKGEDVKALQSTLISLGFSLPKYGIDGKFGKETESAVKAFQASNSLKADGKYGPLSHGRLSSLIDLEHIR